jgi:hypothetical protein
MPWYPIWWATVVKLHSESNQLAFGPQSVRARSLPCGGATYLRGSAGRGSTALEEVRGTAYEAEPQVSILASAPTRWQEAKRWTMVIHKEDWREGSHLHCEPGHPP